MFLIGIYFYLLLSDWQIAWSTFCLDFSLMSLANWNTLWSVFGRKARLSPKYIKKEALILGRHLKIKSFSWPSHRQRGEGRRSRGVNLWRHGCNFAKWVIKDSHLIPDLSQTGTENSFDQEMRPTVDLQRNTQIHFGDWRQFMEWKDQQTIYLSNVKPVVI